MLIRCVKNNSELIANWWQNNSVPLEDVLTTGKNYIVYGIIFSDESVYYEILTVHSKYTFSYPSILFEIIDNRLSSTFCLGSIKRGDGKNVPFISFKEWVNNKDFYSNLVDQEDNEVEVFNKYVQLMELEYVKPNIAESAIKIDANWVQCPVCTEAWEIEYPNFEMCVCPNCRTYLLNPQSGAGLQTSAPN